MNGENEHDEDVLILDDEIEEQEPEQQEGEEPEEQREEEPEQIGFDDEDDDKPKSESELIRVLRQRLKDQRKDFAEQRRTPEDAPIVVGDKPTMEVCDYDEDRYTAQLDEWHDRKRQADERERRQTDQQTQQQQKWQQVTERYNTGKAALPYRDKDEAEEAAFAVLPDTARAIIAKVADDPAKMIYALGRSPGKLAELAKIDDPLELVKAITKMEAKVTTKTGKRPPDPDRPLKGGVVTATKADKELERLEKEADRTGDRSALAKYRASKREK
jgi:hypothetical protein